MKFIISISLLLVTYFLYGFYINQYETNVVPPQISNNISRSYNDYKGTINIHTNLSSGSSDPTFITTSAKNAELDFLIFTDVNVYNVSKIFTETYTGDILSLFGAKYSYLDSRIIYYSPDKKDIGDQLSEVQMKLADIISQKSNATSDSLTILAHPYKAGFEWQGDLPSGLDGFELLNMKSLLNRAWESSKVSMLWSLAIYPFNPKLAFLRLFSEPTDEIALYDRESVKRPISVFAGTEASARTIPLSDVFIRFPSYKRSFEFMSNHILLKSELTGNLQNDRQKIFTAFKKGNFYLALDLLGDTKGFNALLTDGSNEYLMGSHIKFKKNLKIKVNVPPISKDFFEVVLYKDGAAIGIQNIHTPEFEISAPGTYRIHVRVSPMLPLPDAKKWITWIYTNSFYITP